MYQIINQDFIKSYDKMKIFNEFKMILGYSSNLYAHTHIFNIFLMFYSNLKIK